MNRQINGLLYFYITNFRNNLVIFWSILLLTLVVAISFAYFLLGVGDGFMGFGFQFGIYFYCIFMGFMIVKETIPFAIKIGATRKNIMISIGLFFFLLVVFKAIIANTLQEIVLFIIEKAEITSFVFIHPAMLIDDTWGYRVLIDICITFFLLSIMFIIGLVFYKHGLLGGGIVGGVIVIGLLLSIAKGWIFDFISNIVAKLDMFFFYQVLGVGFFFLLLSFLFIRKITIETRK